MLPGTGILCCLFYKLPFYLGSSLPGLGIRVDGGITRASRVPSPFLPAREVAFWAGSYQLLNMRTLCPRLLSKLPIGLYEFAQYYTCEFI
jgi:hypothetical protein